MIKLFPRSRTYLLLSESLVFLIGAALYYDGKPLYWSLIAWAVLALAAYVGVSAYAVRLNGKLLSVLMVHMMPGEFIRLYSPLLKTPGVKKNILFRMQSYMVTAYTAAGSFEKALTVLDGMEILPGRVESQCRGITAAARCSVFLYRGMTDRAQEQYDILSLLGDSSGVSAKDRQLLRARIELSRGIASQENADLIRNAMKDTGLPLVKNEMKLWLGQCYYLMGRKDMGYPYLKEAAACPKELYITAQANKLIAPKA